MDANQRVELENQHTTKRLAKKFPVKQLKPVRFRPGEEKVLPEPPVSPSPATIPAQPPSRSNHHKVPTQPPGSPAPTIRKSRPNRQRVKPQPPASPTPTNRESHPNPHGLELDVSADLLTKCLEATNLLPRKRFNFQNYFDTTENNNPVTSLIRLIGCEALSEKLDTVMSAVEANPITRNFLKKNVLDLNQRVDVIELTACVIIYAEEHGCKALDIIQTLKMAPSHLSAVFTQAPSLKTIKKAVAVGDTTVDPKDMETLRDQNWLNDKVCNCIYSVVRSLAGSCC